jgi:hypothetical protein
MICTNANSPQPDREFTPTKHNQRFCSDACKMQGYRSRYGKNTEDVLGDQSAVTRGQEQWTDAIAGQKSVDLVPVVAQLNDR